MEKKQEIYKALLVKEKIHTRIKLLAIKEGLTISEYLDKLTKNK